MKSKACAIFVVLCVTIVASTAHADAGEARLEIAVDNELAILHHPDVDYGHGGGAKEYVPRIGVGISFGLSEWLDVGLGVRAAVPIESMEERVNYQNFQDGDLFSSYWDLFVPVTLALRWPIAPTFAATLHMQAGGAVTRWHTTQMQSSISDFETMPRIFPIERMTQWEFDMFWRVGLLSEWRPSDWFAVGVGPYVSRTVRFRDWHVGINVCVSYIFAIGAN